MTNQEILSASSAILKKAKQFGVHLAGYANADDLKVAPSFITAPKIPVVDKVVGTLEGEMELNPGEVNWPKEAKSILAVAVEHPENKPELDWWYGQISPSGNKLLINAIKALCEWIPANFDIDVFHFPYFIEQGGIYLKDAAVMAGLGCIGRNNMVVTPEFGPRVRLRAMALSIPIPSTGPPGFDPSVFNVMISVARRAHNMRLMSYFVHRSPMDWPFCREGTVGSPAQPVTLRLKRITMKPKSKSRMDSQNR